MKNVKTKVKDLVGKVVCKTDHNQIDDHHGKYPRLTWVHEKGFKLNKRQIKYEYVEIHESPHYHFVLGNKEPYIEYMNTKGWKSGYGKERINAHDTFQNLIDTFDDYKPHIKHIEVVEENGKYAIVDGLHRASILYSRDPEIEVDVRVIKCREFTNLPM